MVIIIITVLARWLRWVSDGFFFLHISNKMVETIVLCTSRGKLHNYAHCTDTLHHITRAMNRL